MSSVSDKHRGGGSERQLGIGRRRRLARVEATEAGNGTGEDEGGNDASQKATDIAKARFRASLARSTVASSSSALI